MISKKTKYGLKALIYLARRYDQRPIAIADLARDENIPKKFLEAILLALKNNGIMQSKKGKGGAIIWGGNRKTSLSDKRSGLWKGRWRRSLVSARPLTHLVLSARVSLLAGSGSS